MRRILHSLSLVAALSFVPEADGQNASAPNGRSSKSWSPP